jgi:hypothetical protein
VQLGDFPAVCGVAVRGGGAHLVAAHASTVADFAGLVLDECSEGCSKHGPGATGRSSTPRLCGVAVRLREAALVPVREVSGVLRERRGGVLTPDLVVGRSRYRLGTTCRAEGDSCF